jgi:hypothetical protein
MDNKYHNGKIYRIVCNITGLVYIGGTCKPRLSTRLAWHRYRYKRFLSNKEKYMGTSSIVLENNDYFIELVDYAPCETKDELNKIEGQYIRTTECVNKNIPGRSIKEYHQDNKERRNAIGRQYVQNNKEAIRVQRRQFHQDNKERINIRHRQYYQDNKEQINIRHRQYHQDSKEASTKVQCDLCKSIVSKINLSQHKKTNICKKYSEIINCLKTI